MSEANVSSKEPEEKASMDVSHPSTSTSGGPSTPVSAMIRSHRPSVEYGPVGLKLTKRKRDSLSDPGVRPAPNPFNMTKRNFPKRRVVSKGNGYSRSRSSAPSNLATLEVVRAALQPSLNSELERVMLSYQELYRMAAYNTSDNTGDPVTEEDVNHILRRSLDEAKLLFSSSGKKDMYEPIKSKFARGETSARHVIIKKKKMKRNDAREMKVKDNYDYPPLDELRLTPATEFIMGVKANKLLGFAAARGRLYMRHQELYKYMGDQDDKQWLYENSHMPITGGKAFLMIADDIRKLATTHLDYKDNLGLKDEDIKGFIVPDFMFNKIQADLKRARLVKENIDRKQYNPPV